MKPIGEFLADLDRLDVKLWDDDGYLGYSAPPGVLTPNWLDDLRTRKEEILAFLQQAQQQRVTRPAIQPVSEPGPAPLSFAQQRLWILDQLDVGPAYNAPPNLEVSGRLNVAALARALNDIVQRHESLRTTFAVIDGEARQVIHDDVTLDLPIVDLQHLPAGEQDAEVRRLAHEAALHPFDLNRDMMLRAKLLRLTPTAHVLLLTLHHIASDGWSIGVLLRELSTLYEAFVDGSPSPLPKLPIQYADFAQWQRQWLQGEVLDQQLTYWKQQLADAPPVLELPTDRPRPASESYRGRAVAMNIDAILTQQLQILSQQAGTTLFMTLLAAFQVLLYRHTGQDDLVVGTPIANRSHKELEPLIGFFLNTLALRADLSGSNGCPPTFLELLDQVRQVTRAAYEHQDLPFERLVEELQLRRSLNLNPLVQVLFQLQYELPAVMELTDVQMRLLETDVHITRFDLAVYLYDVSGALQGSCVYNSDLFDATTIQRLVMHFRTLLEGIVTNPDLSIAELPLLTEAERHQILFEWNDTAIDYPAHTCLHQLVEQQVARTPDAPAVIYAHERLTYHDLNARANQLAHYLQAQGVAPDTLVGICMPRSLEMVVGLLAILKAGGAYVPLDPAYPKERLAFMLADTQMPLVLTQASFLHDLPEHSTCAICPETEWVAIASQPATNPSSPVTSQHLAYVLYTSGSTGQPKGVAIEHQSPVALVAWSHQVFTSEEVSGVLASTSICFDLSVFELFMTLSRGGTVILADNALHLPTLPHAEAVTLINTVPSAMTELVRSGEVPANVRVVNLAGEPLKNELVQRVYASGAVEKVFNLYGPSEDTTYSTWDLIAKGATAEPTIGRPVSNTQAYIVDRHLSPVPVGTPGELYLGGAGLARGYYHREELTRERFVANPFGAGRLYRTGDLVRWLSDGRMEFLGRMDNQVKIRGFRIELGEIEVTLAEHPEVREAVVIAREDQPGDQRLVAYVVGTPAACELPLAAFLRQKLPDYMVPAVFVHLDALPLTPNGKVDRRALPAPDASTLGLATRYVPPRNPAEAALAAIWAEILDVEQIGVHDNFFELGGHSLLATRVISRIRAAFAVALPLRSLFQEPTVAGLATCIGHIQADAKVDKIEPAPREDHLPLSFAQQRLWLLDQLGTGEAYHIPIALALQGPLDVDALARTLTEIVRRHESLRTTFTAGDGEPQQVIHPPAPVPLPLVDLSHLPGEAQQVEVQRMTREELQQPFNLASDLMLRAKLLRLRHQEHVLLLTQHHIATDGWSIGVLGRELAVHYETFTQGAASPLPELTIQYADFAHWQRQWLQGVVLETQLEYWRGQLADAPPLLALPTDHARPAVQTFHGAFEWWTMDAALTQQLAALSRQAGATLFMTLLAAFKVLLARYSGQKDIVVGTPIANRHHEETEKLIGFFVNTLVLRTQLHDHLSFAELLAQVQRVALDAYAHQDVPFELLVESLQPERNLSHSPVFQVMFVLQNVPMEPLELSGLTISPLPLEITTAKFDLTLGMEETEQGLRAYWEYNSDLFESATIARMAGHFQTLLEAIAANPEQAVHALPLLTEPERQQVLVQWNATQSEYPSNTPIHQLFEAQAACTPDAVAIVFENQSLTYRALNRRANQLAHDLQALGVGPETLVGLCIERSLEMAVGILGILKADGAYVPLDPAYPQDRLAFMLTDTHTPVILTQQHLRDLLPNTEADIVCVDAAWERISRNSSTNPTPLITADHLAYVMYTSGSTGRPKGIGIVHRNVVRLVKETNFAQLTAADVFLQYAPISLDAATLELWGSLLNGGCLVLPPPQGLSVEALGGLVQQHQVTTLWLTAGLFHVMVEERLSDLRPLRQLLAGGDVLSVPHVQRVLRELPGCQLINGYGPTENTTFTCCYAVSADDPIASSVPIGGPIANTQVYIVDAWLQPVPIGVAGELCAGGHGVGRGYLNRASLTAERFVPNPYGEGVLYRTGDLARWLPNGVIEFLGRMDTQVKLRGFRIELGEVEVVLSQHPDVRENVVVVREDRPGDKRLIAYVVTTLPNGDMAALRTFLRNRLPDYMIPSAFVPLDALPLTPSGKVDRHVLPAPDALSLGLEARYTPPRNDTEETIAAVWCAVLGLEKIGVDDNFFHIGGHSLLATQVIARLCNAFEIALPLRQLFERPTVASLAEHIKALAAARHMLPLGQVLEDEEDEEW